MTDILLHECASINEALEKIEDQARGYSVKDLQAALIYIGSWLTIWLAMAALITISLMSCQPAKADLIDLSVVAQIESSNNPLAYNPKSEARGLYQITPICLLDYNDYHPASKIALEALFEPLEARKVASWYLDTRIPQLLRFYHIEDTIETRLWAYNAGIGNVVKGIKPKETVNYIKKYLRAI